tara:strand:- start:36 stop:359 length:324 start_codon:yes stop_codon:yes gene_type:complete
MSVLKSDDSFVKSPIIPNIKNPEIIKEFLYQCLLDKDLKNLDDYFSTKPNNFDFHSDMKGFSITWAKIEIMGLIETLPPYLNELKNSDKCFLLFGGDPLYRIVKIDY